ncbi:MAG: hypothetical protein ACOX43_01305 [Bacilli bacterium]
MKLKALKKYFNPKYFLKFKSMNIIISICIFVIFSFLLGMPIGQKKVNSVREIYEKYNYDVLEEIPDTEEINEKLSEFLAMECRVSDGIEFTCGKIEEKYALYETQIEFEVKGITKRITLVVDLFDIPDVYLEKPDAKINYNPKEKFVLSETGPYQVEENVENYLIVFWSDALYFQAHPFGTDVLNIEHQNNVLRTETMKIFYQNNIPEFDLSKISPKGPEFGNYLLEQFITGNANTLKLRSYTLSFLVGVFFTLIIVLVIWVFFRKRGILKTVKEYYNIAAIVSMPLFILFFFILWFLPQAISIFIFCFSLLYLLVIYSLNTSEELV